MRHLAVSCTHAVGVVLELLCKVNGLTPYCSSWLLLMLMYRCGYDSSYVDLMNYHCHIASFNCLAVLNSVFT